MKQLLPIFLLFLVACRTTNSYIKDSNPEVALKQIVENINTLPENSNASLKALPIVYKNAVTKNLQAIASEKNNNSLSKWSSLLNSYISLERINAIVSKCNVAIPQINTSTYKDTIALIKKLAAEDYYAKANSLMLLKTKANYRLAKNYYARANDFIPIYKNANEKLVEAENKGIINIILKPISYSNSISSFWVQNNKPFLSDFFQSRVINSLNKKNEGYIFYLEDEAKNKNITPDWVFDIKIDKLIFSGPKSHTTYSEINNIVSSGTDTSGKLHFEDVTAKLVENTFSYEVTVGLSISVINLELQKVILNEPISSNYFWAKKTEYLSGDQRAYSSVVKYTPEQSLQRFPEYDEISKNLFSPASQKIVDKIERLIKK
jgi:hypothetical protein